MTTSDIAREDSRRSRSGFSPPVRVQCLALVHSGLALTKTLVCLWRLEDKTFFSLPDPALSSPKLPPHTNPPCAQTNSPRKPGEVHSFGLRSHFLCRFLGKRRSLSCHEEFQARFWLSFDDSRLHDSYLNLFATRHTSIGDVIFDDPSIPLANLTSRQPPTLRPPWLISSISVVSPCTTRSMLRAASSRSALPTSLLTCGVSNRPAHLPRWTLLPP